MGLRRSLNALLHRLRVLKHRLFGWSTIGTVTAQVVLETHRILTRQRLIGLTQLYLYTRFFITQALDLILNFYFGFIISSDLGTLTLCLPCFRPIVHIWMKCFAMLFEILLFTIEIIWWFLYIMKVRHNSFWFFHRPTLIIFHKVFRLICLQSSLYFSLITFLNLYLKTFSMFVSIFYTHLLRIDWCWLRNCNFIVFSKSHSFFCKWCTKILVLILSYFMNFQEICLFMSFGVRERLSRALFQGGMVSGFGWCSLEWSFSFGSNLFLLHLSPVVGSIGWTILDFGW